MAKETIIASGLSAALRSEVTIMKTAFKCNSQLTSTRMVKRLLPLLVGAILSPHSMAAPALNTVPSGGQVTTGLGVIQQTGSILTIQQQSAKLITQWDSFDIGANATVNFLQPSSSAQALNRVLSANPSQIFGKLNANGQVFLVNPSGVVFGESAVVNSSGLVAAGMRLSDEAFLQGQLAFEGDGYVQNDGRLTANNGGYIVMVGGSVANTGTITATGGSVALLAGDAARIELTQGGLVGVEVSADVINGQINQQGVVLAEGGRVWLSAEQAAPALTSAINLEGTVRANGFELRNGEVWLDGGQGFVDVSGTIEAKGLSNTDTGGKVVVTAQGVRLSGQIDASGGGGGGEVYIGGGWQGKDATISEAKEVIVDSSATLSANAKHHGDGGTLVVWSSDFSQVNGTLSARGEGVGTTGGAVETSSRGRLGVQGVVDVSSQLGQGGQWLLDPANITVSASPPASDTNVSASPNFSATADDAVVTNTSIEAALNSGASVTISTGGVGSQAGDIFIETDISKTSGGDASLVFDALNNIILSNDTNISSTTGRLNVDFGTAVNNAGTITIGGKVASNGGAVNFYKDTVLASGSPVDSKYISAPAAIDSGDITFYKNVTLSSTTLSVLVSAQGSQSGSTFVGNGGNVVFNGSIESGLASGFAAMVPQALSIDGTGVVPGAISLGATGTDAIGTQASPLASLTLLGPTLIGLEAGEINLAATSGDVLLASSRLGTPVLQLGAQDTAIRVTGGVISGVDGYADYRQETFDIGVKDALARTLLISSDRSIKIKNRVIDGVANGGAESLTVVLDPFTASAAEGGAVVLDGASILSNGGDVVIGGLASSSSDYAIGYGGDVEGVNDGVRIFNSVIDSAGGDVYISGAAPTSNSGGEGVKIYGLTNISSATGDVLIHGLVTTQSTAGNKDAVVIGEGSNSEVTLQTSGVGAIHINGDASAVVGATSGSRYDGVIISQGALLKTDAGDISITGKGGSGADDSFISDENHGIKLETQNTRIVSTSGDISLYGTSGGKSNSYGIYAKGNTMYLGQENSAPAYSGIITLEADSMALVNSSSSRLLVESLGEVRIRPENAATDISFDSSADVDHLHLGNTWFAGANSIFQPGASAISVGRADATGTMTVANATTVRDDLNLFMGGVGGNIILDAPLTVQGAVSAARTLALDVNAGVSASGLITADAVHLTGGGDFALTATNLVDTLAVDASQGSIQFNNAQTLNVGTVSSTRYGVTSSTVGVTAIDQAVMIATSGGDLFINENIAAGNATVALAALAGAVSETGTATVTADGVIVRALNSSALSNDNAVGKLAAEVTGVNQGLVFVAADGIIVDSLTDNAGGTVDGLSVAGITALTARNGNVTQTQAIDSQGLVVTASGEIDLGLSSGANRITQFAANAGSGAVELLNNTTLFVDSLGGVSGVTTNDAAVTLNTAQGNLYVDQHIDAGTGVVSLTAQNGGVQARGAAIIHADKLALNAQMSSSLTNLNEVGVLAARVFGVSQDLAFVAQDGISIEAVTDGTGTLLSGLSVAGNTFLTASNGAITQTVDVSAGGLYTASSGQVNLDRTTNAIGTLAADVTGAGVSYVVADVDGLAVAAVGGFSGITNNNGDITLNASADASSTAGDVVIAEWVQAGNGTVILTAGQGAVLESGNNGRINAAALYVEALNTSTLGNSLNDVDTLSALITGQGQGFEYADIDDLTINTVNAHNAVLTNNGDIVLSASANMVSTSGDLNLAPNAVIDTSGATGKASISLRALKGAVVETASNSITGSGLSVVAQMSSSFDVADHDITRLAAQITRSGENFSFSQAGSLTIGSVDGVVGINTAGGDISIVTTDLGGAHIFIDQPISTGYSSGGGVGGTVSLAATGGIVESAPATINAEALAVRAGNFVLLEQNNNVATVAARVDAGGFSFRDVDDLEIAEVLSSVGHVAALGTLSGVDTRAGNGEQFIAASNGDLSLNASLRAGSGLVSLEAGGVIEQQDLTQTLSAQSLRIQAAGDVSLLSTNNNVEYLAAQLSNGRLAYRDVDSLEIGTVSATLGGGLSTAGLDTATGNGEQFIAATGGDLILNASVTAGTGIVSLEAGGVIDQQDLSQSLVAQSLRVNALGDVSLLSASNNVALLAANVSNGSFAYRDIDGLALGSITATLGGGALTTAGVDTATANGEQFIAATGGDLILNASLTAGTGLISLAAGGTVDQQDLSQALTAQSLRVNAVDGVSLLGTNNDVTLFAGQVSNGSLAYRDIDGLELGSVTATLGGGTLTTAGVDTATGNGEQFIGAMGGDLILNASVTAGTGIVSFEAGGVIDQQDLSQSLVAQSLRINAVGDVALLSTSNDVDLLAANVSNGRFAYRDVDGLELGSVVATLGGGTLTTAGVDTATANGEQFIGAMGGDLILSANVDAGTGLVSLETAGALEQQDSGQTLKAQSLRISAVDDVSLLSTANDVDNLAGYVDSGDFFYQNSSSLVVGDLAPTVAAGATISGVNAGGAVFVSAAGDLTLDANVSGQGAGGTGVVLAADKRVYNNAGVNGISAPNSRWLVYDVNPTLENSLGGISGMFVAYETTFESLPPEQVLAMGNGYLTTAATFNPSQYIQPLTINNVEGGSASGALSWRAENAFTPRDDLISPTGVVFGAPFAPVNYQFGDVSSLLPISVHVPEGRDFTSSLSYLLDGGVVHNLTAGDGFALPAWLAWSEAERVLSGNWPVGRDEPLALQLTVWFPETGTLREFQLNVQASAETGYELSL